MVVCIKDELKWLIDHRFIWKYNFRRDKITHIPYCFLKCNDYEVCINLVGSEEWFEVYKLGRHSNWLFSSECLRECLDFCDVLY